MLRSVISRATLAAPITAPPWFRMGEMATDADMTVPSLRTRYDSKGSITEPRRSRARIDDTSSARSAGTSTEMFCPMISPALYPYMRCAPAFQLVITPSRVLPMTASYDDSTIAASIDCAPASGAAGNPALSAAMTPPGKTHPYGQL